MKHLLVSADNHSKVMQYKAKKQLRSADEAVGAVFSEKLGGC